VKRKTLRRPRRGVVLDQAGDAPTSSTEASIHARTRLAHREEHSQDYVEAIADLIRSTGEARVTHIARKMGVSHVTVTKIIHRLQREGLVDRQPHRPIVLTKLGSQVAARAQRRHKLVIDFLIAVGVKPVTAAIDAEGIEHHVSDETVAAFSNFVRARAKGCRKST